MGLGHCYWALIGIDVVHCQGGRHDLNARVIEWKSPGGVHGILQRRGGAARGEGDHLLGRVDPGDQAGRPDPCRERSGQCAGAAAEVDRVIAGSSTTEGGQAGVDAVATAERHQSGESVIAPRVRHDTVPVRSMPRRLMP